MNELIKQINLCESKAQDADSVFYFESVTQRETSVFMHYCMETVINRMDTVC